jgi:alpha,alpha-trehalase
MVKLQFKRITLSIAISLMSVALSAQSIPPAQTAEPINIYIRHAWSSLSRSDVDCASLADPKSFSPPIVYVPAEVSIPSSLAATVSRCRIRVEHLPRPIHILGDISPSQLSSGLLYLPFPYVVPGGRFNEMYGWDSFFIVMGLIEDGQTPMARNMLRDFIFEIEHYGGVLNANRTYYLSRSQPPLFPAMLRLVWEAEQRTSPAQALSDLKEGYRAASVSYGVWTRAPHLAGSTGLARYEDTAEGPVPEMADDPSYYLDVIRWLIAHPGQGSGYLVDGPEDQSKLPEPERVRFAAATCDAAKIPLCARAHIGHKWLSSEFFRGDRATRESGFDVSFHLGPFGGDASHYASVSLNSLLYRYETDMADFAGILGYRKDRLVWKARAAARQKLINQYLWNEKAGRYLDYDFVLGKQSTYDYLTTFYPLWARLASPAQASALESHLSLFEHPGGLAMSAFRSGMQWDLPYGWAPTNWFAISGLQQYGFKADATRLSREFLTTVQTSYDKEGTIHEKYDVVTGSADVKVIAGYRTNVIGFGWTNGVFIDLQHLVAH